MQLPLSLKIRTDASFENYYPGDNQLVYQKLIQCFEEKKSGGSIYIWGEKSVGKTHLLQATCLLAGEKELTSAYVPLSDFKSFNVQILDGLETMRFVCVDDVDAIHGLEEWEEGLFNLYNRALETGNQLIFAASKNISQSSIKLADLQSRFSWGFVYALKSLCDEDKKIVLQERARSLGLELNDNVIHYLLNRFPRNLTTLFSIIDDLDKASLITQRKITIPLIKQWVDVSYSSE